MCAFLKTLQTFSYLKHQVLPITKFSFYSGNVTFTVAENLFNLYEHCKELLDTNGNGWADPISDFSQFKVNIEPLNVNETPSDDAMKACGNLAMNQNDQDNSDEDMLVALPKIETEDGEDLSMIWLPLKRKRVFNINSRSSSFILFRYFVMVSQCHNYQGIDQSPFNKKLKVWMTENVLPYLEDDTLYPAFGAALRILETVKGSNESGYQGTRAKSEYRKGSHKTLFDDDNDVSGYEFNSDGNAIDWMMNYALVASGALIALVFFIFLLVRACKRCRSGSSDNQKPSCLKKLKNFFLNRSHQHEPDEFYEYRKVSSGGERSVVFENEKKGKSFGWLRKSRTKRGKEKINLPLLGSHSDTDGDIEHHNSHSSKTSLDNRKKEKFKISESSDEGEKSKKLSKTSAKINQSASGEMKKGSSGKMRPRSPFRRGKN